MKTEIVVSSHRLYGPRFSVKRADGSHLTLDFENEMTVSGPTGRILNRETVVDAEEFLRIATEFISVPAKVVQTGIPVELAPNTTEVCV